MTERKPKYENEKAPKAAPKATKVNTAKDDQTKAVTAKDLNSIVWEKHQGVLDGKVIDLNLEHAQIGAYTYARWNTEECLYISANGNPVIFTTKGNYYDEKTGITWTMTGYEYQKTAKGTPAKTYKAKA